MVYLKSGCSIRSQYGKQKAIMKYNHQTVSLTKKLWECIANTHQTGRELDISCRIGHPIGRNSIRICGNTKCGKSATVTWYNGQENFSLTYVSEKWSWICPKPHIPFENKLKQKRGKYFIEKHNENCCFWCNSYRWCLLGKILSHMLTQLELQQLLQTQAQYNDAY